jgi:hypothetical protein
MVLIETHSFTVVGFFDEKVYMLRPVHASDFTAISSAIFFWRMWMSKPVTNVEVRENALNTFLVNPLVHIIQMEKIAAKYRSCEQDPNELVHWIEGNFVFNFPSIDTNQRLAWRWSEQHLHCKKITRSSPGIEKLWTIRGTRGMELSLGQVLYTTDTNFYESYKFLAI